MCYVGRLEVDNPRFDGLALPATPGLVFFRKGRAKYRNSWLSSANELFSSFSDLVMSLFGGRKDEKTLGSKTQDHFLDHNFRSQHPIVPIGVQQQALPLGFAITIQA